VELDPSKELKNPEFNPGDGVAICHSAQGYGANMLGNKALLLKSLDTTKKKELRKALRQVTVTLSMEEFLKQFFGLWHDDAIALAKILGYEIEPKADDYYKDYIADKVEAVTLIKALEKSSSVEEDFFKLSDEDQDKINDLQKKFEKGLLSGGISGGAIVGKPTDNITCDNANSDDN